MKSGAPATVASGRPLIAGGPMVVQPHKESQNKTEAPSRLETWIGPNHILFMSKTPSHEIQLVSRPNGIPTAANFAPVRTELEPLQAQQALVRNLYMSEELA